MFLFLCVYRTWGGAHLAAMTSCSPASEIVPLSHLAEEARKRFADKDSLQTITWNKKESYLSKSNISQPVNLVNVASFCRPRAHVIVPYRLFHFCSMRYLCHIKARLLNPPFLAIVRHFLSLRDGWICLLGNLHQLHVINVSRLKEANCDSLNQQSFLLYLTAQTEGSLRKPVSSGLLF